MATGTVSASGLGSGIDIDALIETMRAAEEKQVTLLTSQNTIYEGKVSAYEVMHELITAFDIAIGSLLDPGKYNAKAASSSSTSVATMTASKSADAGTYNLSVTQLAQAQKVVSNGYSSDYLMGTGTLEIELGSIASGSFVGSGTVKSITIDSSNNTLSGIRDAINAARAGVTAMIINDGTNDRLVLTSDATGEEAAFNMTVSGATGDLGDLAIDVDNLSSSVTMLAAAQNAEYTIDGIPMTSTTNSPKGNIKGLSLELKAAGTTVLTVSTSTDDLKSAITSFVEAYNSLYKTYKEATQFVAGAGDDGNDLMGPLNGDSTIRNVMEQFRRTMTSSIGNISGGIQSLSALGITTSSEGALTLDETMLDAALADSSLNIEGFFRSTGKPSTSGITFVSASSTQVAGNYTYSLQRDASGNITGTINGVSVTVNGNQVSAGGITLLFEEGYTNLEGNLYCTNGLATQLRTNVDNATNSSTGSITSRVNSLNSQITDTTTRITTMTERIDVRMERLRARFNMMDTYLAQMNSLSTFLTQTFDSMNSSSSSKK